MADIRTPLEVRAERGAQMSRLDRLISSYVEEGYSQTQARARALSDIARENMAQKYSVEPARLEAEDEADKLFWQQLYRRNPRLLAGANRVPVDPSELPGYDPTRAAGRERLGYDPITREITNEAGVPIYRFSQPLSRDEIINARTALPIPQGSVTPDRAPGLIERAMQVVRPASEPAQAYTPAALATTQAAPASAPSVVPPAASTPVQAPVQGQGPIGEPVGGYDRMRETPPVGQPVGGYDRMPTPSPVARAVQVARQSAGVPVPPQRPDSLAVLPPPHGAAEVGRMDAVRRAWEDYNRSESPAAFVEASKLMQRVMPQAEARGGGVSSKSAPKPDPVHKALEIIHHLLIHGR